MFCPKCGSRIPEGANFCTECGAQVTQQATQRNYQPLTEAPQPSMKWFKFLIYFSLWAGAILNLSTGLSTITGMQYEAAGVSAVDVYAFYGSSLKTLDILYGAAVLALAVFFIYTRFRLARFKKNGPSCIQCAYLLSVILSIIYMIGVNLTTGINALAPETISSIVSSCVIIAINGSYFKKRSHLFVN